MQFSLAIAGALVFLGTLFLLPETIHPHTRGADKVFDGNEERNHGSQRRLVLLNPFASLALLRSPNLLLVVSSHIHISLTVSDIEIVSVFCRCNYIGHGLWYVVLGFVTRPFILYSSITESNLTVLLIPLSYTIVSIFLGGW